MPKVVGRAGLVKVNGNTVAALSSYSMDESMAPIDNSDLSEQELTYVAGDITRSIQITCKWDKADTTGQGALAIGTTVTLVLQREGDTSGDETITLSALVTATGTAVAKTSMISQTFTLVGSGAKTVGAVV